MFLIVGLPGAGKTTVAKRLAADYHALRLTPDAWMIPLFGESDASGKRDVLEGRLIWLALEEALKLNTSVVLDFGFWGREERSSLRWLAGSVGAACEVVYVPVDRATQLERIRHRWVHAPHETFAMTASEVDRWNAQFEPPNAAELTGQELTTPPPPWPSWADWAADRWPSLVG